MEEREIDLLDLIADVLSHWRGILISMLIGALIMGGFSCVRSLQNKEEAVAVEEFTYEDQLQRLEEQLKDSEKLAVHTVIDTEREYAQYQQYTDNSVLMKADPYKVPRIELLYVISVEEIEQSDSIRSVYENLLNGIGLLQWVEEQTGMPASVADELISVRGNSDTVVLNGGQKTTRGNACLKVVLLHSDETECEELAQAVKDYVEQQKEQLTGELGAHEVVLLAESAGTVMDTGVRDRQLSYANTMRTLLTNCANAKETFSEDQKVYYEVLVREEGDVDESENQDTEEEVMVQRPSISMKYVVVGAVLFAFAYAGVFFVLYILNGKLRSTDELQRLYHISQLGLIVKDDGGKKFFVDRWISAMRHRKKRRFSAEQSLELAATAVKISAEKQELDSVCLVGCDLDAGAGQVCRTLKELLEQESISVTILDNVLYDAGAMERLGDAKGIVLVEKAASTLYDEITREMELIARQGIELLGGIVVE